MDDADPLNWYNHPMEFHNTDSEGEDLSDDYMDADSLP